MSGEPVPAIALRPAAIVEPRSRADVSQVEILSASRALPQIREQWSALFESLSTRHYAQSPGWFEQQLLWLDRDPQRVWVAIVRDAGALLAVVPVRHCPRAYGPFRLARWSLLWHPHATVSPFVLAPQASLEGVLFDVVQALCRQPGGCDQLLIPSLSGEVPGGLSQGLLHSNLAWVDELGPTMGFDTTSPDMWLAGCTPHFRRNLARQRRRLAALGRVEMELVRGPAARGAAFDTFLDLEVSGWKGAQGTGSAILLHPRLRQFYQGLIDRLQGRQDVCIALLRLDGRAVAAHFCVRTDATIALLKIAYDESLRQAAPGNVLLAMQLESCADDAEISRLSLVTGPSWAERWRPLRTPLYRVAVFRPGWRGRCLRVLVQAKRAFTRRIDARRRSREA